MENWVVLEDLWRPRARTCTAALETSMAVAKTTSCCNMKLSMSCVCRQAVQPQVNFQGSKGNINVFKGLDIATNKVTEEECKGIPHHLLGVVEPGSNFTATDFRIHAAKAVESIVSRDRLPIIAG
ncbi:hypothetical protein Q3G72_030454 [Acer saccharum]|nr:hypothetical protein Q3G72_030454 [Acer saccharum]